MCGKRLVATIPTLLPALKQHGRLELSSAVSAATIDRMLGDVKIAAAGGRRRRRRAGFYSAILSWGADPDIQRRSPSSVATAITSWLLHVRRQVSCTPSLSSSIST